jgi:hypothetical protein
MGFLCLNFAVTLHSSQTPSMLINKPLHSKFILNLHRIGIIFTLKWNILVYYFMVLSIFGGIHFRGHGYFQLAVIYSCIFSFVGNIMLFILCMMQILARNAGCHQQTSTRISRCKSSLQYPQ